MKVDAQVPKPLVVCVDDDPAVLDGLEVQLRREFTVDGFTDPERALAVLETTPEVAVVLSDMRMPQMDGAQFLSRAHETAPLATRVLLTGQADVGAAILAVNHGHVFRFLTKPCATGTLLGTVRAAAMNTQVRTAERDLLEQTVRACVATLMEVLSQADPVVFGGSQRLRRVVMDVAQAVGLGQPWELEVAALLAQVGQVILPADTARKLHHGVPLDEGERRSLDTVPAKTLEVLGRIPRMDVVRDIVQHAHQPQSSSDRALPRPLRERVDVLRMALSFDALERQGMAPPLIVRTLRARGQHPAAMLTALAARLG